MNILITGATGFIGSYLVDKLLEDNSYKLILLKRSRSNTFRIEALLSKVKIYNIDNISLEDIFLDNNISGIIHLATNYVKSHQFDEIDKLVNTNITFPTKLLELSVKYKANFFINTGTFFEYDLNHNPVTEKNEVSPYNLYASTKLAFDNVIKFYVKNSNLNIITLKLSAPYGYNDNPKLVPYLIKSVLKSEQVVLEKGEQEWDFIYVKDVVSAYIKTIDLCLNTKRSIYEEILIGTGKKTSIKKIANIINNLHGEETIKLEKDYPPNQIFVAYIDNSKARNILQWIPQYSIEEGLAETYNLYKENKDER